MRVAIAWLMIHILAVYAFVRYRIPWNEAVAGSAMWLMLKAMEKSYKEVISRNGH